MKHGHKDEDHHGHLKAHHEPKGYMDHHHPESGHKHHGHHSNPLGFKHVGIAHATGIRKK